MEIWKHYLLGTKFVVVTDNVANTYFKTQKKLKPKQAQWQKFLAEFDFTWVYRPESTKEVKTFVAFLSTVQSNFLERTRQHADADKNYGQLKQQVKDGLACKYWLDDDLLYVRGN